MPSKIDPAIKERSPSCQSGVIRWRPSLLTVDSC